MADVTPPDDEKSVRETDNSPASTTRSLTGRRTSQSSVSQPRQSSSTPTPTVVPEESEGNSEASENTAVIGLDGAEAKTNGVNGTAKENVVPPLSAKSTSDGDMDEISLTEAPTNGSPPQPPHSRSSTLTSVHSTVPGPRPPPHDSSSSTAQGLPGTLQNQLPPTPPPPAKSNPAIPPPDKERMAPPVRKLTSPFSWLSRNTPGGDKKTPGSPPTRGIFPERRDTTASNITLRSDSTENILSGGDESKATLKDRFAMLRMQGENGTDEETTAAASPSNANGGGAIIGLVGRSASIGGLGVGSPSLDNDESANTKSPDAASAKPLPSNRRPSIINPKLLPGTAAGVEAAPDNGPVDWDLWQTVVYEGPAAVARTSESELKDAIAGGIPAAIRGVVWLVLADSQNEELQRLYKDLIARGVPAKSEAVNGSRDKESIASSASSVRSVQSSAAHGPGSDAQSVNQVHSPTTNGINGHGAVSSDLVSKMIRDARSKWNADFAAVQRLEKVIKRDMGARTSYSKYLMSAGLQDGLFGVCKAYALLDEQVGYAQGMNFIAMPLLFNLPEEEAFSLLTTLMTSPKHRLRTLFTPEMPGLHLLLYQFSRALEDADPVLYCHLHRRGVEPRLYATQWFLTLFAYRLPLQLVLRVYDFVLSEGLEAAVLRFALALVKKNRESLLATGDMAQLTTFLKEKSFDVYIDKSPSASSLLESGFFGSAGGVDKEVYKADVLVSDAVAVQIKEAALREYEAEWTESSRAEKEREVELEGLRSSVATLTAKVRKLEEAAEKSDREHVVIASDLVRTKVENEELRDESEGLRGQVEELRRVVQTQTEDVEKKMKGEMEAVMERNVQIFGENRRLEEELREMETVLVGVKMELAQMNSEHDALKQKWNSIAGMMKQQK